SAVIPRQTPGRGLTARRAEMDDSLARARLDEARRVGVLRGGQLDWTGRWRATPRSDLRLKVGSGSGSDLVSGLKSHIEPARGLRLVVEASGPCRSMGHESHTQAASNSPTHPRLAGAPGILADHAGAGGRNRSEQG